LVEATVAPLPPLPPSLKRWMAFSLEKTRDLWLGRYFCFPLGFLLGKTTGTAFFQFHRLWEREYGTPGGLGHLGVKP